MALFEFQVSRRARDLFGFEESLFSFDGRVILADLAASRAFARKINAKRRPEQALPAGRLNAMGLIDELQHGVVEAYREQKNSRVMSEALEWLKGMMEPIEYEVLKDYCRDWRPYQDEGRRKELQKMAMRESPFMRTLRLRSASAGDTA